MIKLQTSEHAKQRIKERMGITDKRKIKEVTKYAYHYGISIKKHYIPKTTLKWIDKRIQSYAGRCLWRIYKNFLFLYSKNLTLVTVYELPKEVQIKKSAKDLERW